MWVLQQMLLLLWVTSILPFLQWSRSALSSSPCFLFLSVSLFLFQFKEKEERGRLRQLFLPPPTCYLSHLLQWTSLLGQCYLSVHLCCSGWEVVFWCWHWNMLFFQCSQFWTSAIVWLTLMCTWSSILSLLSHGRGLHCQPGVTNMLTRRIPWQPFSHHGSPGAQDWVVFHCPLLPFLPTAESYSIILTKHFSIGQKCGNSTFHSIFKSYTFIHS